MCHTHVQVFVAKINRMNQVTQKISTHSVHGYNSSHFNEINWPGLETAISYVKIPGPTPIKLAHRTMSQESLAKLNM